MKKSNFKRGYFCKKCFLEQKRKPEPKREIPHNEPPLYTRKKGVFKFSGLVLCATHGATPAVKLMDVAR